MNSKERVKAALNFNGPDKIPIFNAIAGDVAPTFLTYSKNWNPGHSPNEVNLFPHEMNAINWDKPEWLKNNPKLRDINWKKIPHEEVDEWGTIWSMKGNDSDMGHPGRASLPDLDNLEEYLEQYHLDPHDETRYKTALKMKESYGKDKYHMIHLWGHGPNQVVSYIRGFSTYLIDHAKHPSQLKRLLKHIVEFHIESIKMSFEVGLDPDGFWYVDDLGEQNGPFFSPRVFKEFHAPGYKKVIDTAHRLGADLHLHCCGKVDRLLPTLIECGLDAIEFDSPRMSGYPDLKPYRGKIMFWGCVNIQSIYAQGSPEEVEREVWHMVRNLGTKKGGFGAYFYPTPRVLKAPRRNIKAFQKGIDRFGDYSKIPEYWWDYPVPENWNDAIVPPLPPI